MERQLARARELLTLDEADRAAYLVGEALALWRGRALMDLDRWDLGRIEADRLEELRRDAEELRLEAALRSGHHRDVLAEAQTRVPEAPLRERRWCLLALAPYQAARQGDALRTIHQVKSVLRNELGLDPGPDLSSLEEAILRQDPSLIADAMAPEPSSTCPYLGLVPYDVNDADAFFGRDSDITECLSRLTTFGVLAVVGPSGSGKSSLVRAGLAPAQHSRLVIALRADRLGDLSSYPDIARLVEHGLCLLSAMGEDDLRAAIDGPARQAGLRLEPGLVDVLVGEVEGEPGALPLLPHALQQTRKRREGATLTLDGYHATGGIRDAVARSAEELYEQVPTDQRPMLRDLLLRLVTPTSDGEPVRSRVPRRLVAADPGCAAGSTSTPRVSASCGT